MIQPYHGDPREDAPIGERLEAAGRILGIAVAGVLMVGGLILCFSVFYAILNVVKDPSVLSSSQQEWQLLLGAKPLILETSAGTIDLGPILALGAMGVATLLLVHLAIQITATGGRMLPLVMGERKAIKGMLREALAQHRELTNAPVEDAEVESSSRLKF